MDDHGHQLINNFRAIQPLGDRKIRRNIGNTKNTNLGTTKVAMQDVSSVKSKIAQDVKNLLPPPPKKKT